MSSQWRSMVSLYPKKIVVPLSIFIICIDILGIPISIFVFPAFVFYILAFFAATMGLGIIFEGIIQFRDVWRARGSMRSLQNKQIKQCAFNLILGFLFMWAGVEFIQLASLAFIPSFRGLVSVIGVCIDPLVGISILSYVLIRYRRFKEKSYNK